MVKCDAAEQTREYVYVRGGAIWTNRFANPTLARHNTFALGQMPAFIPPHSPSWSLNVSPQSWIGGHAEGSDDCGAETSMRDTLRGLQTKQRESEVSQLAL